MVARTTCMTVTGLDMHVPVSSLVFPALPSKRDGAEG